MPEAIEKLQEQAFALYARGEWQKALALQQEVMAWVNINLPALHPFRAKALIALGDYLSKLDPEPFPFFLDPPDERALQAKSLPPILEAVKIYRALAQSNPAFLDDLSDALFTLGDRYDRLHLSEEALPPLKEVAKIVRGQGGEFTLWRSLERLGFLYLITGRRSEAIPCLAEGVKIIRKIAKTNIKLAYLPISTNYT